MDAANCGAILSATAATVAAVLAGLNLWLTGRRQRVSWARSALESAFVDFLTAVYDAKRASREIGRLKDGGVSHKTEADWRADLEAYHDVMMQCVTRFRVLASDDMAETAIALHQYMDDGVKLLENTDTTTNTKEFWDFRESTHDLFVADRDLFVKNAKVFLALK